MKQLLTRLGVLEEKRYSSTHGYKAAASDLYDFDPRHSIRHGVILDGGGFNLPHIARTAHSALLKVTVRSTRTLSTAAPHVEFRVGHRAPVRHYFDKGASGIRYLDISALLDGMEESADAVKIVPTNVSLESAAEVLFFNNEPLSEQRVLVLSPHPDDAEIAAFGLYKNSTSAVVTITAGDAGRPYYKHIYPDAVQHDNLKRRLRVWDSLVVPMWGGVAPENIANLGYFDATLKQMHEAPDRAVVSRLTGRVQMADQRRSHGEKLLRPGAVPTWTSLVLDLVHILDTFRPTIVVTPHPVLDAHTDHRLTTLALLEALGRTKSSNMYLYTYINHSPFCVHWPFGPPANPVSLPPWPINEVRVRGFYSYTLGAEDVVDKLFALESMHDLRRPPPSLNPAREWGLLTNLFDLRDYFLRRRLGMFSFLRRGVRSQETFFVYKADDVAALLSD